MWDSKTGFYPDLYFGVVLPEDRKDSRCAIDFRYKVDENAASMTQTSSQIVNIVEITQIAGSFEFSKGFATLIARSHL